MTPLIYLHWIAVGLMVHCLLYWLPSLFVVAWREHEAKRSKFGFDRWGRLRFEVRRLGLLAQTLALLWCGVAIQWLIVSRVLLPELAGLAVEALETMR